MLDKEHFELLEEEFDISIAQLKQMSLEEWREVRLKCFDIEADGTELDEDGAGLMTEKGISAAEICDTTYKEMKRSLSSPQSMIDEKSGED